MDCLGIEMLSVFGMAPVEYVKLTADLGCRYITTGLVGFTPLKALAYQPFSLRDDHILRRELLAAMDDRGVSISLGEGLLIAPGVDVRSYAADLDIMAQLRIPRINTVSLEPDRTRTFDELAALTALAAERGIATCIEPVRGLSIADLPMALAAVEYVDRDEISLLIDTMHVARFGAGADDLRSLPAQRSVMSNCATPRESPGWTTTPKKPCTSDWRPATGSCHCPTCSRPYRMIASSDWRYRCVPAPRPASAPTTGYCHASKARERCWLVLAKPVESPINPKTPVSLRDPS